MTKKLTESPSLTRRKFVQSCAIGSLALASGSLVSCLSAKNGTATKGPAGRNINLDQNWLFGGKFNPASLNPGFNDAAFQKITLPHCVSKLSWQDWPVASWQQVFGYRRHFALPRELNGMRIFLHFDGVMVGAIPVINGHALPSHLGGYLPFQYEITDWVKPENVLSVAVDGRWSNVPPQGSPKGVTRVDYLEAGGIHRSVWLQAVPKIFVSDVFAKPVHVLQPDRQVVVSCTLDAAVLPEEPVFVEVEMVQGGKVVSRTRKAVEIKIPGQTEVSMTLTDLKEVTLWDTDNPHLYDIVTTLYVGSTPLHNHQTRIGLREARFGLDGFFLNGKRLQIFGLNRHEIYPYVGYAMPPRVMRKDAEMLRRDFHCNMVRCSHYPQNEAFLDACDELGLLVWEEVPGWGYLGDDPWKELCVRNAREMIVRDRNHPSIIIWGTRVNESANDVDLYRRTKEVARALDDSRPTSGSMTPGSRKDWKDTWHEDVFAFDDYHADPDGSVGIAAPVEGYPYMLAEAVGQFNYENKKNFDAYYRRTAPVRDQQFQALRHAQAHSKAAANPRNCGVVAWCAFEYASLVNHYHGVKYPGVADLFRIPKLGASFYLAQGDPRTAPAIHPNFYWDFGPNSPKGPGKKASIFSNCERLELFVNNAPHAVLHPDTDNYPNLRHAPFFADLEMDGDAHPELRMDGYVGKELKLSRTFSSDPAQDQLQLTADDQEIEGDGTDATRVVFRITDKYGAPRPFTGGKVSFKISGPGILVGDNPFNLEESGGAGAVWVKALPGSAGRIQLQATHSAMGTKSVEVEVKAEKK